MRLETKVGLRSATGTALVTLAFATLLVPGSLVAQESSYDHVTFTRDIAPILQRSCQTCHREGGVAPMTLVTYQQVRRYSSRIVYRTGLRDVAGAMPPWYVEKDIGIQHFKNDPSLNDLEVAQIAAWVENGMPEGDPADMPPPRVFPNDEVWIAGEPDLIVKTKEILVKAGAPDWWGEIESVATGLTEDRWVASVEIKEVNDIDSRSGNDDRQTVGRRYVFHHMIWSTRVIDEGQDTGQFAERGEGAVGWPVHEVGRNPDMFAPEAGRLLRAGSSVVSNSIHLHSNGVDTRAHLEIGFRFHPKGYEPQYRRAGLGLGNGVDIDIRGNQKDQELHAYRTLNQHTKIVTFEPHLHAPGARMCLEAIWGYNVETLSCVGYDHNWVRGYAYADDAAPLLPKGTILHIVGYMDTTKDNINIADPRNWQGAGNRSVTNMFIDLGMRVSMTDEQFIQEMAKRREVLNLTANDHVIGCPLCTVLPVEEGEEEGSR
ncbi:MAG: hypothetical protein IIC36_01420 [Gemmatimonadetes bacterium]|jgi:hypothetical protein|nr:hypothetical protein [Gemmatimonadota bacterium]